jgi:hypothetical protein
MEIHERATIIAHRLAEQTLSRTKPLRSWAGFGNGRLCDGCGEIITGADVEHEHDLVGGGTLHFHAECSVLWERLTISSPDA